jgi:hypothetical protein
MAHINNLPNILCNGLLSHIEAHNKNLVNNDISDREVNNRRIKREPIYNLSLHNYIPLYINPRNPMLFVRKTIQADILILCFDANTIFKTVKVIYTDGNAAADATKFYSSVTDLNKLDWNCIRQEYWNDFPDGKRKKCAEILVPNAIHSSMIKKIICYNLTAANRVKSVISNSKIKVEIDNGHVYF